MKTLICAGHACVNGQGREMRVTVPGCACGGFVVTYYAVALTDTGKIGQFLVTRKMSAPGVVVEKSQTWTGVTYKTQRAATKDLTALNCGGNR